MRLEEQRVESGCSISTLLLYQGESQNLVHTQMWCSTSGKNLGGREVFQILVVCYDVDRICRAFKVVTPVLKGFKDS